MARMERDVTFGASVVPSPGVATPRHPPRQRVRSLCLKQVRGLAKAGLPRFGGIFTGSKAPIQQSQAHAFLIEPSEMTRTSAFANDDG